MKNFITLILILISFHSFSQTSFEFSKVVEVTANKSDLYVRAVSWLANAFKSSKSVIQMQDKDAGRIIGKALKSWRYSFLGDGCLSSINYTITIDVKDNKARIVLSDFHHEGCDYIISGASTIVRFVDGGSLNNIEQPWKGGFKKRKQKDWDDIRNTATNEANMLLMSFTSEMGNPKLIPNDF